MAVLSSIRCEACGTNSHVSHRPGDAPPKVCNWCARQREKLTQTTEPMKKLRSAAQQLRASVDGNGNLLKTIGLLCGVVLMLAEIELQRTTKERP